MSKNTYIIIGIIAVISLGGFLFLQPGNVPEQATPEANILPPSENGEGQSSVAVTYTDSGYSPREVIILQGGTVTFENQSSRDMWPATAIHPTHTIYPGSHILKCKTAQQPRMFDACQGIAQGESWSFIFQEVGNWGYHDHRNPSATGKIVVE